jgi:hypothetical protein
LKNAIWLKGNLKSNEGIILRKSRQVVINANESEKIKLANKKYRYKLIP